jgi:hypothetical protein
MSAANPRGVNDPAATDRCPARMRARRPKRRSSYPELGPRVNPPSPQIPPSPQDPDTYDPWSFADKWYRWELAQDADGEGGGS